MNVYIISYFGPQSNKENRDIRVKVHDEQLDWFRERNHNIFVLNQDYTEEDFRDDVSYIGDNTLFTASGARNY
jgi:predicted lipid carrier protein YhbT